jgi:hypothetical protein
MAIFLASYEEESNPEGNLPSRVKIGFRPE